MDKTLSQDEVDALLQAIKSGQTSGDEEKVRPTTDQVKVVSYNFRKPHLVSRDQLRGFQMIHESFAKSLQGSLLANLKTPVEVKATSIDNLLTYGEFILSLISPTFIAILSTSPDMGELVIETNLSVVLGMVDILLGGDGGSVHEARELTAIEQSIAGAILENILTELKTAWEDTVNIGFKVRMIESNPEYVRIATSESSILSATFDLRMGETTGTMNICYPFEMIQPILGRVTARMRGKREKTSSTGISRDEALVAIGAVPLSIRAEIGRSVLLTSQLGRLKLGDVLCLDKRIDDLVDVHLGDRCCYAAELGSNRGKVAVRLIRRISENRNESDSVVPPLERSSKAVSKEGLSITNGECPLKDLKKDEPMKDEEENAVQDQVDAANTADNAEPVMVSPMSLSPIESSPPVKMDAATQDMNLKMIMDIPVDVHVEIGQTRLSIRDILRLGVSSVVELDRLAGQPADIIVNGKMIGQGDVVIVNETFGIRITKLVGVQDRIKSL